MRLYSSYHMMSLPVDRSVYPPYQRCVGNHEASALDLPQRPTEFRKRHSLTQAQLAQRIGIPVVPVRYSEDGTSQPALGVIGKPVAAKPLSADTLLFGRDIRGPGDDLCPQLEAITCSDREKRMVRCLLDGMILTNQARNRQALSNGSERKERR